MSDVLSQFRCKDPEPFKGDGFEVVLKPITFNEYRSFRSWWRGIKDESDAGEQIFRKLFSLGVGCKEEDVDGLDPSKVEAVALEVGRRCGFYVRTDEKKDSIHSTILTASSPSS